MNYDESADFKCLRCGACCRWEGLVKVTDHEIDAIAAYLQMPLKKFLDTKTYLSPDRTVLSLIEKENGSCFFYDEENSLCTINPVKPEQCRTFPIKWNFPGWENLCAGGRFLKHCEAAREKNDE